jgi:hypothetical protein
LPKRAHDALVQQRLDVLRIERQRVVHLGERSIDLIQIEVADAEIGAGVEILRIELERGFAHGEARSKRSAS